jgi:hypothetical protein
MLTKTRNPGSADLSGTRPVWAAIVSLDDQADDGEQP